MILSLLLVSTLILVFIQSAKASGGTIYIRADGSIDPPDAPIITYDNVTYTLNDNITSSADGIIVERDNIIIDGAGYTLQGTGNGSGIYLYRRTNVTGRNMQIKNFDYGIYLYHSIYNSISGNTIINNNHGIRLESVTYNNITSNTVLNNYAGIILYYSSHNSVLGNIVFDNVGHGILVAESSSNNVSNNIISNNYLGVSLYSSGSSNNNILENSVMDNNYGLWLYWFGDKIYHNNFIDNQIQAWDPWFPNTPHIFDNGYPSGGNYWSDYIGNDIYSGPYQNETGSDGIGDTLHTFPDFPGGQDRYPLVNPWTPAPPIQTWLFDSDFQYNLDDDYGTVEGSGHLSGKATLSDENLSIEGQISLSGALPSGVPEVYLIATGGQDKELAKQAVDLSGFSYWQTGTNTYNFSGQIPNVIQPINNGHYEAQALITYNTEKYEFFVNTASLINNHYFPLTTPTPPPPPPEIIPPSLIQDFSASDGADKQSTLHWTNPSDSDLAEVMIRRKIGEYPDSHWDGDIIYRNTSPIPGAEDQLVDTSLVNGRVYCYAVFSKDSAGNWNDEVLHGSNADTASPSDPANQSPFASFTYDPSQPKVGKTITFDASSSSDLDGEIVLYEWDWNGDGSYDWSKNNPQVRFIYERSGKYQVGLKVTDNDGAVSTTSINIEVAGLHFWEKIRDDFPWSDRVRQLTKEEYQYIKNQLYIFTLYDTELWWEFRNYYDIEDQEIGSTFHWYTDWDLMDVLNMEMDPEKSPGLTYGIYFTDALREMEKVELTWTQGYKIKASKYFSDLLEANSRWTTERTVKELLNLLIDMLKSMIKSTTPAVYIGVSITQLVGQCIKFGVPLSRLANLLYYNSLWRYLHDRYDGGMSHESAWEELILYPTQDYHIPTDDPEKLAITEEHFKYLYDNYGSYLGDLDTFQREVKKDLRVLLLNVLKAAHPVGRVVVVPHSPIDVRVYDPYGNVTGMINGQIWEEIPRSAYDNETGMILIFFATGDSVYEVAGKYSGEYGLEIVFPQNGEIISFTATDIPITSGSIHRCAVDWLALSQGEEGVTVKVDSDGDGVFEHTFTSDSELTQSEFLAQTVPPPLSVSITPLSASMLVGQSVTFTSTVSGGYTPYSYQWYLNSAPVSSATLNMWIFTPTTGGIYYVYLKVTDAKGNTAQSQAARIVVATVPVGGYSVPIQLPTIAKPVTPYIALLTILTAMFITIKRKTKRKH